MLANLGFICDSQTSICQVSKKCSALPTYDNKFIRITLAENGGQPFDMDLKDILISGTGIGLTDDICVLGIFKTLVGHVNCWNVGAIGF